MVITLRHSFPIRFKIGSKSHLDYPFRRMLVGESFLVSGELLAKVKIALKVYSKSHPNTSFKIEPFGEEIRVWRRK
jgi:hypothetical protein